MTESLPVFTAIVEAMPSASVLLKVDAPIYSIVAASPNYLSTAGVSKEMILGRGLFEAFPGNPDGSDVEGPANLQLSFEKVINQKVVDLLPEQRYDVEMEDGSFSELYWRATNSPVLDEAGNVIYILHSAENISELVLSRKRDVQYKRANKAFELLMQAPVAVCIVKGPDFVVELVNDNMLSLLGRTAAIQGKPIIEALPEAQIQGLIGIFNKVRESRQSVQVNTFEATLLIDGVREKRYFDLVFSVYDNAALTDDISIFCLAHNVTEQVEARQQVKTVTERLNYRNAILEAQNEATSDGVLIVDGDGNIILYNKRFADIWKIPQSVIDSKEDSSALQHAMKMLVNPSGFLERVGELYARKSDRSHDLLLFKDSRIIERNGTPIISEEGHYYGWSWYFRDITEQLKHEQRFRNVIDQAPDPILILMGEDLVLEVANKALLSLWNVDETAIGKPFLEILPEMKDQVFVGLLKNVLHTGEPFYGNEVPAEFVRNGVRETRYVNFSYQPYREANKVITGVLIMATDVTGQVLAKQQKEKSDANFRSLLLQAPVGICILQGEDFIVELVNDSYLEIVQREREAFENRPLWEGIPEVRTQGFDAILKQVLATGEAFIGREFEAKIIRNGKEELLYVDFVYEPLREIDGEWNRIMVVAIDTTSNVMARKKIEEAEERARLAIESAELGTLEVNLLTNFIIASERMDQIMGVTATSDRSKYINAVHPDDRGIRQAAYDIAYQTGKLEYDGRVIWPDKSIHWMRVKGKILFDSQKIPYKMFGVVQDITEQKQFAEELTRQVAERTQQLSDSNYQLQKSNEELEQFAYVSSHDLQEPLRKIKLFSGMVLESEGDKLSELSKSRFEKVIDAADRMSNSLRDLLELASLTKKHQTEQVDLNDVLRHVETDLELLIIQKRGVIKYSNLPTVKAIALQMQQLFYNLLNNALKFSKPDVPPFIEITSSVTQLENSEEDAAKELTDFYRITVSDNGIGFDPANAKKIFTIFQRLHDRQSYNGTGIGLALCKKVVQNHQGDIYADSLPGRGTTFYILLPVNHE